MFRIIQFQIPIPSACVCMVGGDTLDLISLAHNRELSFSSIMLRRLRINKQHHHSCMEHSRGQSPSVPTKFQLWFCVLYSVQHTATTFLRFLHGRYVSLCMSMCLLRTVHVYWSCECGIYTSKPKLMLQLLIGICPDLQHVFKNILPILRPKSSLSSSSKRAKVGILQS